MNEQDYQYEQDAQFDEQDLSYGVQPYGQENEDLPQVVDQTAFEHELMRQKLQFGFETVNKGLDVLAECRRVEAKADMVKEWSQVEVNKIAAKFKSSQDFMYLAFGERKQALSKHYDLLDKAVASNDKDLILAALQGISTIVTKSPLEDLEQFTKLYEDTSQPLLDF